MCNWASGGTKKEESMFYFLKELFQVFAYIMKVIPTIKPIIEVLIMVP